MKFEKFRKEDYLLSFWVKGVSVFVTDIHRVAYLDLKVLYIIDAGIFNQYFNKKSYEKALNLGLKFYDSKTSFLKYRKNLQNHCKVFRKFFNNEIEKKPYISKATLRKFFAYTTKLCKEYTTMNFEHTDKAFASQDQNETIKKNLVGVAMFKDTIRDFMNMVLFGTKSYLAKIFSLLSEQFFLPLSIFENLTQEELLDLFSSKSIDQNKIKRRQEAFVSTYSQVIPYEGKEAKLIIEKFKEEISAIIDEVNGQVANKGRVSGTVKIISVNYSNLTLMNKEINKMKQGDILVAETTAPELIIACKKAGAIVTDVGGLMSHATIVSREFGIPCIIGTKIATKVFKDGDLVEVNANKGIVRKLTK